MDISGNQVHPVVQMFPNNDTIFQDDSSLIHTARSVQTWFEEHEDALQHLPWPAQSPYLNIIKPLWSVLESRVRSRFPPTSSLKQLNMFFMKSCTVFHYGLFVTYMSLSMFHHAFFSSINDKHQHMHFFTFKTVLV